MGEYADFVDVLLANPNTNVNTQDDSGNTALYEAASRVMLGLWKNYWPMDLMPG